MPLIVSVDRPIDTRGGNKGGGKGNNNNHDDSGDFDSEGFKQTLKKTVRVLTEGQISNNKDDTDPYSIQIIGKSGFMQDCIYIKDILQNECGLEVVKIETHIGSLLKKSNQNSYTGGLNFDNLANTTRLIVEMTRKNFFKDGNYGKGMLSMKLPLQLKPGYLSEIDKMRKKGNSSSKLPLISFIKKPAKAGEFTPVYETSDRKSSSESSESKDSDGAVTSGYASVNAGSQELFVGGSGINGAFAAFFKEKMKLKSDKELQQYQDIHRKIWEKAKETPEKVVSFNAEELGIKVKDSEGEDQTDELKDTDLIYCSCRTSVAMGMEKGTSKNKANGHSKKDDSESDDEEEAKENPKGDITSSVFVDVFRAEKRPGHKENVAMVYAVGPKGTDAPSLEHFLSQVRTTGKNIIISVNQYNVRQAAATSSIQSKLPRIAELRVCLVSGGIYQHKEATKQMVARALLEGLVLNPTKQIEQNPRLEFCYDEGVFEEVYGKMWAEGK